MAYIKGSRCAMCDEWYSSDNADAVAVHRHPEPQSGAPRDKWFDSGLSYVDWVKTPDGINWQLNKS